VRLVQIRSCPVLFHLSKHSELPRKQVASQGTLACTAPASLRTTGPPGAAFACREGWAGASLRTTGPHLLSAPAELAAWQLCQGTGQHKRPSECCNPARLLTSSAVRFPPGDPCDGTIIKSCNAVYPQLHQSSVPHRVHQSQGVAAAAAANSGLSGTLHDAAAGASACSGGDFLAAAVLAQQLSGHWSEAVARSMQV
jgi:hypothetical protein